MPSQQTAKILGHQKRVSGNPLGHPENEDVLGRIPLCRHYEPPSSKVAQLCIVWREHSTDELSVYKLNTLTHGTRTAAFLAIRVMHQLSYAEEESFPFGAKTV